MADKRECVGTLEPYDNGGGYTNWRWIVTDWKGDQKTGIEYTEAEGLRALKSELEACTRRSKRFMSSTPLPSGSGPRRGYGGVSGAMPPGFKSFTAKNLDFDFFEPAAEPPPRTKADDFRFSQVGDTFEAGGQLWLVRRVLGGYQERLVQKAEDHMHREGSFFAQLHEDGVLTVHAVSKRGDFRPIGRALAREKVR